MDELGLFDCPIAFVTIMNRKIQTQTNVRFHFETHPKQLAIPKYLILVSDWTAAFELTPRFSVVSRCQACSLLKRAIES